MAADLRRDRGDAAQDAGAGGGARRGARPPRGLRQDPARLHGLPRWPPPVLPAAGSPSAPRRAVFPSRVSPPLMPVRVLVGSQARKADAIRKRYEAANLEILLGDKDREARSYQKIAGKKGTAPPSSP